MIDTTEPRPRRGRQPRHLCHWAIEASMELRTRGAPLVLNQSVASVPRVSEPRDGDEAAAISPPVGVEQLRVTSRTEPRVLDRVRQHPGLDQQILVGLPEIEHPVAGPP